MVVFVFFVICGEIFRVRVIVFDEEWSIDEFDVFVVGISVNIGVEFVNCDYGCCSVGGFCWV